MLLAVFHEFAHPEVLEEVKKRGICEVDVASHPNALATSPEEIAIVRTNAKLITVAHHISGLCDAFDSMSPEEFAKLSEEVDRKVAELVELGFVVVHRHPQTSAGCPMVDRVILSFPE